MFRMGRPRLLPNASYRANRQAIAGPAELKNACQTTLTEISRLAGLTHRLASARREAERFLKADCPGSHAITWGMVLMDRASRSDLISRLIDRLGKPL